MLAPGVLVVSEPDRVGLMAAAIVANRRAALPGPRLLLQAADVARAAPVPGERPVDLAVMDASGDAWDLSTLRAAREVLLLARGDADAEAVRAILEGPAGPAVPASLLRDHPALTVICDAAAAARLSPVAGRRSDRVVVVLGHREPGVSPEHRISAHSRARMFRAEEACLLDPVRAAVLTGYTQTGGLSEAEQMQREWTVPGVPVVTEVAGRSTAENASRCLPLILAMGGIREVLVVTSRWHLRAPYFFAPYARYGLRPRWRPARPLRHWGHLLVEELAKAPAAPLERTAAMREVRGDSARYRAGAPGERRGSQRGTARW